MPRFVSILLCRARAEGIEDRLDAPLLAVTHWLVQLGKPLRIDLTLCRHHGILHVLVCTDALPGGITVLADDLLKSHSLAPRVPTSPSGAV